MQYFSVLDAINRYDNIFLKANINSIDPLWTDKYTQCYLSLNGICGNPNSAECDKNESLCTLARTQTRKTINENYS